MWKLVRLSLAYHRRAVLWTLVVALLIPKLGLVIAAIVGLVLLSAEDKERRLLLYLPLPVTRAQVGWARVVFPAMIVALATAAYALLLSAVTLYFDNPAPAPEATGELLIFAAMVMFFIQLVLTMEELQVWASGRLGRTLEGGAIVVGLLSIALMVWIGLAASLASLLVVALGTVGLSLGLMRLTVSLFQRRPSFTSS